MNFFIKPFLFFLLVSFFTPAFACNCGCKGDNCGAASSTNNQTNSPNTSDKSQLLCQQTPSEQSKNNIKNSSTNKEQVSCINGCKKD